MALANNRGKMDEYIAARFAFDESIPLCIIEPLYCSFFLHKKNTSYSHTCYLELLNSHLKAKGIARRSLAIPSNQFRREYKSPMPSYHNRRDSFHQRFFPTGLDRSCSPCPAPFLPPGIRWAKQPCIRTGIANGGSPCGKFCQRLFGSSIVCNCLVPVGWWFGNRFRELPFRGYCGAAPARQPSPNPRTFFPGDLPVPSFGIRELKNWRRKRDSNPRAPFDANGFQDRRFQPLTHSSTAYFTAN